MIIHFQEVQHKFGVNRNMPKDADKIIDVEFTEVEQIKQITPETTRKP